MTTKKNKFLASLLLSVVSSLSYAQVTGNIIDPNAWDPTIPMNSVQVAAAEGCCTGPTPVHNTDTNTIRFSYVPYTVSQIIAINTVLAGKNIAINGFNYSWQIYNDLSNWGGTRGSLAADVNFADTSGSLLNSYHYDYSNVDTGAAFQLISGTETFNNPYDLSQLGYVGVAFTGKDINWWGGYYGPRVRDPQLTLNYSVALPHVDYWNPLVGEYQSFTLSQETQVRYGGNGSYIYKMLQAGTYDCGNGLFGSDPAYGTVKMCSIPGEAPSINSNGYNPLANVVNNDAFKTVNNNPQPSQTQQAQQVANNQQPPPPQQDPGQPQPIQSFAQGVQIDPQQPPPAQPPPPAPATQQQSQQQNNPVVASNTPQQNGGGPAPANSPPPPPSSSPQQAGGPSAAATQSQSSSKETKQAAAPVSALAAISMFQNLQSKEQKLVNQTVQNASQAAQAAVAQTEQTAMAVATRDIAAAQTTAKESSQQSESSKTTTKDYGTINVLQSSSGTQTMSGVAANINSISIPGVSDNLQQNFNTSAAVQRVTTNAIETNNVSSFAMTVTAETDQNQAYNNYFVNRSNPMYSYIEKNTQFTDNGPTEFKPATVKSTTQDNELAGGVRVESLAVVPNGYSAYTSFFLRDAAFYEPKEIYKNVNMKDNARSMYFLEKGSSDTYKKMIENQYK